MEAWHVDAYGSSVLVHGAQSRLDRLTCTFSVPKGSVVCAFTPLSSRLAFVL